MYKRTIAKMNLDVKTNSKKSFMQTDYLSNIQKKLEERNKQEQPKPIPILANAPARKVLSPKPKKAGQSMDESI